MSSRSLYKKFITTSFCVIALTVGVGTALLVVHGSTFVGNYMAQMLSSKIMSHVSEKGTADALYAVQSNVSVLSNASSNTAPLPGQKIALPGASIEQLKKSIPAHPKLNVSAAAYVAADLQTGQIIIEKNRDSVLPIASITKIITAATADDLISRDSLITLTPQVLSTEGNSGNLKINEKMKSADLMYPLLLVSSNDAAEGFAEFYGRQKFIDSMNRAVKLIGARSTFFKDPSGLSYENVSTADDLLKIVQWLYTSKRNIIDTTRIKTKSVTGHVWVNPTHFLNMSSYIGGKNGYTDEAERTAISIFSLRNNGAAARPIVIIILHSMNRDNDMLAVLKYLEKIGYR